MLDPEMLDLGTPTTAYRQQMDTAKLVLLELANRRQSLVPGMTEYLQDKVHVDSGDVGRRPAHGWFYADAWQHEGHNIDEIFLNADLRNGGDNRFTAEDWFITLVHEAAHLWNHMNDVRGTSNRGRYHNREFAQVAVALGLHVTKHYLYGHLTPCLQPSAQVDYADLIALLDKSLVMVREPAKVKRTPKGSRAGTTTVGTITPTDDTQAKYIFACCACQTARGGPVTIRMAKGSWREDVAITCSACGQAFGVSTAAG
ncbi:hypothetical protein [Nocardia mexicana]|uniref:SprT-like family protein n=1 Tax=Nocardia mexicana TaxID=279262 RepID=A0A370HAQ3_9NOCA|nr:hypothetical protein [Nocardia mexicana]RDI54012.1 SprT-like family protein [Nocardia mexicana]